MKYLRSIILIVLAMPFFANSILSQEPKWITAEAADGGKENVWIEFSKEFELKKNISDVSVRIAADSKYWLSVNGERIVFEGGLKRGPNPDGSYYDVVNIGPALKKGKNNISMLLCYFGKDGFSHKSSGKPGIIFNAEKIGLVSDSSWESRILSAYQQAGEPEPNFRLSESNIRYDARLEGKDAWGSSVEVGDWGGAPWGILVQRPIPLWKDYGVKYSQWKQGTDQEGNTVLTVHLPYNMQLTPVVELSDITGGTCISMETDHIKGGSEYCVRAEYVTKAGRQKYESLGWMNGEELRIIYPKDAKVEIHAVGYRETGYNCEFEGSFSCSDEMIEKFWAKAMRTLYVNMRDNYFDCPDRERAQWWGDVTILIGQSFYQLSPKANALVSKAIHELVSWQREDDVLFSPVPAGSWGNELPAQMLASVSTYGFWYYYLHTGDVMTMKDAYPAVRKYLSLWELDSEGLTAYRSGDWSWGDWGSNIDLRLVLASWHYLALKSAALMAELTGFSEDIAGYKAQMESISKAYDNCWNGYAYRHPSYHGETDDRVNAMAVLAGIADSSKYEAIFELFKQQEHASPYMEKYVLEALMKMGKGEYALERFKNRFGDMINDECHTTLFEGWEEGGYGGGSTNHAWSGGMLTVIAENVCGVRPLVPGWKEFEIRPYPVIRDCSLDIPCVTGMIRSSFSDTDSSFVMSVSVPAGTKAYVILPESDYKSVMLNGKFVDEEIVLNSGVYEIVCLKQ